MPEFGPFVTIDELPKALRENLLPRASEIESIRLWNYPRTIAKIRYKDGSQQKWKYILNRGAGSGWRQVN